MASALDPLKAVEARLAGAPTDVAEAVRKELDALRRAGPHHNPTYVRLRAAAFLKRLERVQEGK